jgi:hypothetical protein
MRWVRHRRVYRAVGRARSWHVGCTVEAVEQAILTASPIGSGDDSGTSTDVPDVFSDGAADDERIRARQRRRQL